MAGDAGTDRDRHEMDVLQRDGARLDAEEVMVVLTHPRDDSPDLTTKTSEETLPIATEHYALQQWSGLSEKPSVEIREDPEHIAYEEKSHDGRERDQDSTAPSQGAGDGKSLLIVCTILSLQYAKLVIVLGLVLPISGVLASKAEARFYEGFYLYLYLVSLLFMLYMYITAAWRHRSKVTVQRMKSSKGMRYRLKLLKRSRAEETVRYGSVYLRLAMNAFGIGSMVYCCLEVAHELSLLQPPCQERGHERERTVRILMPTCRAALVLGQLHFMLFNDKAAEIRRSRCVARVGLAHMIATNICEWLSVVVEEARNEIAELDSGGYSLAERVGPTGELDNSSRNSTGQEINATRPSHHIPCASEAPTASYPDVLGNLLQSSGPFLFPCTIEYSLICAVMLFEMWKHAGKAEDEGSASRMGSRAGSRLGSRVDLAAGAGAGAGVGAGAGARRDSDTDEEGAAPKQTFSSVTGASTKPWCKAHHLSVDLTHSQRGMFLGIMLTVATILSLVLFFAMGEVDGLQHAAHCVVSYLETGLHAAVVLAVVMAALKMRQLSLDNVPYHPLPLDLFLLLVAQAGAYLYSVFSIVGSIVLLQQDVDPTGSVQAAAVRVLVAEVLAVVHAGVQTHFILRAWHMRCRGEREWNDKPGREHVTFLMYANLCMWLVATFCKSRAQFRPVHLALYGLWPWTVLTHSTIPLTIFLHFHSSICLFEIWKLAYKYRPD